MPDVKFAYPKHINLANLPTPVRYLSRISSRYGVEIYIKQDEMTGTALSGNKVRKLEFVLAHALEQNADTVITCGGAQSNHCRATAIAAAMAGLDCCLLLRTPDPLNPPETGGNILLDKMAGAEIVWITPEEYKRRDEFFEKQSKILQSQGKKPYIIPEGASDALGAWGYIKAMQEIKNDIAGLPEDKQTAIIHATGSGGTAAGLILGAKLHKVNARIASINVCDDRDYFTNIISNICKKAINDFNLDIEFSAQKDIEIIDGYVGRGYALSRPEELSLICEMAKTEGIFLDPVYTGKAFYGMIKELEKDPKCFGSRIIFIHTGGIFGLFSKSQEFAALFK
ncbi:D-cysteine desulfhydrase family protein, pyridoxal phosphate-dependent [Desulfonema limicola]|uniref:D-cysteine desulfhydrase family protein, pyridoxal phosphate-dependent n=1 Tax=Desulfonema limicola TaxID=45656 RepID=A0A975BA69_9BACT|nr:D-cysteine desulfhydrase family protein [Desulfonema limicola]QTA81534.1 D-cysteine desulfhydrase family protein, pyridoxal phosphate-dependent [Desulfonema limicola]